MNHTTTLNTFEQRYAEMLQYIRGPIKGPFVTSTPSTVKAVTTQNHSGSAPSSTEQENTKMHDAWYAIQNDLAHSYRHHHEDGRERFHADPIRPKSMAHVAELFAKGHYVKPEEKEWTRDNQYDNPLYFFEFREHAYDEDGHRKFIEKLDDTYRAATLKAKVLVETEPKTALDTAEKFRSHTFH